MPKPVDQVLERQKLEQRQREFQWKQVTDVAKPLGWLVTRLEDDEEDSEYEE